MYDVFARRTARPNLLRRIITRIVVLGCGGCDATSHAVAAAEPDQGTEGSQPAFRTSQLLSSAKWLLKKPCVCVCYATNSQVLASWLTHQL